MGAYAAVGGRQAAMEEQQARRRIVAECQQGSRDAFRQLFETYKDTAYGTALHFLGGDAAGAEDVTQEVFVRLSARIGQFRNEADFSTYLYRLVANACMDEHRRRKRLVSLSEAGGPRGGAPDPSPDELCLRGEVADAVRAAVGGLPPPVRMTILLRHFEQLSYDEMARILGCSKGTIASRLHRGHKILARRLGHLRDLFGIGPGAMGAEE